MGKVLFCIHGQSRKQENDVLFMHYQNNEQIPVRLENIVKKESNWKRLPENVFYKYCVKCGIIICVILYMFLY